MKQHAWGFVLSLVNPLQVIIVIVQVYKLLIYVNLWLFG
jgi:hypothetical protein